MDTIDFLKERDRMCKASCDCGSCPGEGAGNRCMVYLLNEANGISTEKAKQIIAIVEEWSKAHPRKTMMQDFFEKFPNAPRSEDGTPNVCPNQCGYIQEDGCCFKSDCLTCWSRPVGE